MSKRLTRKETFDEVVELINKRTDSLIRTARDSKDAAYGRELAHAAWELQMVVQDIENSSKEAV